MTQRILVTSYDQALRLMELIVSESEYAIDTETDGLNPYLGDSIIGMSFYFPSVDEGYYIAFRHRDYTEERYNAALDRFIVSHKINRRTDLDWEDVCRHNMPIQILRSIIQTLNQSKARHIFFNAMFDMHMLAKEGYIPRNTEDVMLAAHLLNENEYLSNGKRVKGAYQLKRLAKKYLTTEEYDPVEGEKKLEAIAEKYGLDAKAEMYRLAPSDVSLYAILDTEITWKLLEFYWPALEKWNQVDLYKQRCYFLQNVLFPMEKNGFDIDLKLAKEYEERNNKILEEVDAKLPANVNYNSPTQVKKMFKRVHRLNLGSTDFYTLKRLAIDGNETAEHMLVHRKRSKENSAFFSAFPQHVGFDGKVHPSYYATGTNAGRISCGRPNLQQAPKKDYKDPGGPNDSFVKDCFKVPKGWTFVLHDFGQLELRLAAHYAKCQTMIDLFNNGQDLHQYTADQLTSTMGKQITRFIGKTSNFGLLYGMGGETASNTWLKDGIALSSDDAWEIVNTWNATYPEYRQAKNSFQALAQQGRPAPDGTGDWKYIQLFNGRTRKYHEFEQAAQLGIISYGDYVYETSKAWNNYIQGTAAGVAEESANRVAAIFGDFDWFYFVLAVHDSLGYMVRNEYLKETVRNVTEEMTKWNFDVPMIVDTNVSTTSWYDLHPLEAA